MKWCPSLEKLPERNSLVLALVQERLLVVRYTGIYFVDLYLDTSFSLEEVPFWTVIPELPRQFKLGVAECN